MKRKTRKIRKTTHSRPRGDKWPGDSFYYRSTRTGRRRGTKARR